MEQISWRGLPRKRFSDLLGGPRGGRMCSDGDVHDAPSMVGEHDQHEQQQARGRRHHEKIGGRDLLQVIRQEGAPGLRRPSRKAGACILRRWLDHGDAKLQEFAVNSRCTPEII